MKAMALLLLIATAHAGYLFAAAGTHLFGLSPLPDVLALTLWLALPTAAAGYAYGKTAALLVSKRRDCIVIAIFATLVSLYLGVYAALNTFGE